MVKLYIIYVDEIGNKGNPRWKNLCFFGPTHYLKNMNFFLFLTLSLSKEKYKTYYYYYYFNFKYPNHLIRWFWFFIKDCVPKKLLHSKGVEHWREHIFETNAFTIYPYAIPWGWKSINFYFLDKESFACCEWN